MKRNDIYKAVTTQIVEALEAGTRPWNSPFLLETGGLPKRSTGEYYKGINVLILSIAAMTNNWSSPYWFTFNQAKKLGAKIKKHSTSTPVVFYKTLFVEDEDTGEEKIVPVLKSYKVFNAAQIENLPEKYNQKVDELPQHEKIQSIESFFNSAGVEYKHFDTTPHFNVTKNEVVIPEMNRFITPENYYAVLGHEFIHATGHETRLDRDFTGRRKGTLEQRKSYAFEELIAEIGASFLMPALGLKSMVDDFHAPYIDSYIQLLKEDERIIFKAAAKAQQAVDFLFEKTASLEEAA
jgi:antirestriction protein ArdC